jgi:4-hydroxybenzoate polyprenyltransferase
LGARAKVLALYDRAVSVPRPAPVLELPQRRESLRAALVALRPRQWTKNALLFAGIVFAAKLGDAVRWLEALAAFAAYCAASSAAYLVNDVRDVDHDRAHPVKRSRPIARGELTTRAACALAVVLAAASVALVASLGWPSLAFLAAFFALQAAYTAQLKHIVLIDVMTIAALFVVRAAAGASAVHVRISPWLLLCTALLALFLALAKRRGELVLVGAEATPGRPVLAGYSLALVDQLVSVVAACTVIAYSLYTFTARDSKALMVTIPFVVFGVFRYLLLIHRSDLGEEPEEVLLRDRPILTCIVAWAICAAVILLLS